MPTFRRAHQIGATLRSVLDQSFGDFEVLVRDEDGSDGTGEVVAALGDSRVRYHRNANRLRMPGNLNSGIRETIGEYVLVCHDHDLYDSKMVEKMVGFLDAHPSALFVHAGLEIIDAEDLPTGTRHVAHYAPLTPGAQWADRMLSSVFCNVCADSMVRRLAHERYGLYDPEYGFVADVEMWLRLSLRGDVGYIAEPLIRMRQREEDHEHSGPEWELLDVLLRMQRRYHAEVFRGWHRRWRSLRLAMRADALLLRRYLGCIVRGDREGRARGRRTLRSAGALLSHLAARAL
jgi:glycosyltransferase involved in cell wall biosynthesis